MEGGGAALPVPASPPGKQSSNATKHKGTVKDIVLHAMIGTEVVWSQNPAENYYTVNAAIDFESTLHAKAVFGHMKSTFSRAAFWARQGKVRYSTARTVTQALVLTG